MTNGPPSLESPPLTGREAELATLRETLDRTERGQGGLVLLSGDGGIGKTRLAGAVLEEAERRGWGRATGAANPVESGMPYALFADALLPALAGLDADRRTTLTRGVDADLQFLFPSLGSGDARRAAQATAGDAGEFKSRVLWNFMELVRRYTEQSPLLVILEDLHWADAASLELLHFLIRHTTDVRLLVLGTYKPAERRRNAALHATLHSLLNAGRAREIEVGPLSRAETERLVQAIFDADPAVMREFVARLHEWTGGNPFFLQETLQALVSDGRLHRDGDQWLGWEVHDFDLPASIRDAILIRLDPLDAPARAVADLAAVVGSRVRYETLSAVADLGDDDLLRALEALLERGLLVERGAATDPTFEFSHPLIGETVYTALGGTRALRLHGQVAEALERHYGAAADAHADELAYHFSRARGARTGRKAARYLARAGRDACAKYANAEAATYLAAALEKLESDPSADAAEIRDLLVDLGRTRQRLGDYDAALAIWERVRHAAAAVQDDEGIATVERRMGLACFWSGRLTAALQHYDAGLAAARRAAAPGLAARLALARGMCLHELGRPDEAKQVVRAALDRLDDSDPDLVARMHRALMLLHVWTGPTDRARTHGAEALRLAAGTQDRTMLFSAHWGLGVLEGLNAHSAGIAREIEATLRIAEEINSPVLRAWSGELEIEYAAARGEWDAGIAIGERTIAMARGLHQSTLLPRLLVWTALLYLPRGDIERAARYVREAWILSGAGALEDRPPNLHTVIPAHIGQAALHLARGEYEDAIRVGEAGMALADRHGYVVWTIHRLVPIIAEANMWLRDLDRARRLGRRLRRDSERQGHRLGLAWADACDALVAWLSGDPARGAVLLRNAAEQLEAVPFVFDAARVRRQLAGRLAEIGDREGALRELRAVHDVFARLGAGSELDKARDMFRELDARPPARAPAPGAAGLTGRELEIARLVMQRKSNKAIGRALDISARTVSTHLSNIYRKLEIGTRGELADFIRRHDTL